MSQSNVENRLNEAGKLADIMADNYNSRELKQTMIQNILLAELIELLERKLPN
jgi:hypothetical protein